MRINGFDYGPTPWEPCAVDDAPGGLGPVALELFLVAVVRESERHKCDVFEGLYGRALATLATRLGRPLADLEAGALAADWPERSRAYLAHIDGHLARAERSAVETAARMARVEVADAQVRLVGAELRAIGIAAHMKEATRPGAAPIPPRELEILCKVAGVGAPTVPATAPVREAEPDFERMSVEEMDRWAADEAWRASLPRKG